uniref:Uncharacterized protein n=1 Tax=Strongyloides venezuelensis TaxID=75913 RepID=A0A0K0G4C2_STRVS
MSPSYQTSGVKGAPQRRLRIIFEIEKTETKREKPILKRGECHFSRMVQRGRVSMYRPVKLAERLVRSICTRTFWILRKLESQKSRLLRIPEPISTSKVLVIYHD